MVTIFFRTLLIYFALIAIMRLMGKRQIGELEVTDLVTTLLISETAALPITDRDIPVTYALIPMVTLLILEVISSVILVRFPKCKHLVSATPTVIIRNGELNQAALRSLRISMEELMGEIRQQGYGCLSQIDCAILEKNGKMTVIPKAEYAPPTAEQLGITCQESPLMHVVFNSGTCNKAGLSLIGKDEAWLMQALCDRRYLPEQIFCVTANCYGELLVIPKQLDSKPKPRS